MKECGIFERMKQSEFILETGTLTAEEFIHLCRAVGWGNDRGFDLSKVVKAIADTSFTVKVKNEKGETVACGRAFSDDLFMTFIPDIFVHPKFQRHGLGTMIMEAIKGKYGHTIFYFGAQPGKESFYENLGFKKGMQSYTGTFKKNLG